MGRAGPKIHPSNMPGLFEVPDARTPNQRRIKGEGPRSFVAENQDVKGTIS
jgi:hypothetical protein